MTETYETPLPPSPPVQNSTMAIVSLVAGILGWTLLPFLGSIAAIITGHMAKSEIKKSEGALGGGGLATVGLVLGYVSLGLFLCACIAFVIMMALGMLPLLTGSY